MVDTPVQTVALIVGIIGIAAGGLGSLCCLAFPFFARRQHLDTMGQFWVRAVMVLILNALFVGALIQFPLPSHHGAFACFGFMYGVIEAYMVFTLYDDYKRQMHWREVDKRIERESV